MAAIVTIFLESALVWHASVLGSVLRRWIEFVNDPRVALILSLLCPEPFCRFVTVDNLQSRCVTPDCEQYHRSRNLQISLC